MFGIPNIAITGAVVGAVAFAGGWKVKGTFVKAAHADAMEAAQEAHIEALEVLRVELDGEAAERRALAAQLELEQSSIRTITKEVIREIPKYIKDSDGDCDRSVSPDFARLYNESLGLAVTRPDLKENAASYGAYPVQLAGGDADQQTD